RCLGPRPIQSVTAATPPAWKSAMSGLEHCSSSTPDPASSVLVTARASPARRANPADPLPLGSHAGPPILLAVLSNGLDALNLGTETRWRLARMGRDDLRLPVFPGPLRPPAGQTGDDAGESRDNQARRLRRQRAAAESPWRRVRLSDPR